MSTWQVSGQGRPLLPLPVGLRVAGLGPRLGAWFLDLVLFALLSLIPLVLAIVTGAVGLNSEAARQINADPYTQPTVPWLIVSMGSLIAWAAVWVALAIGYAAACWAFFRGMPGQRLVGLQVADAGTGKNLSLPRAALRAVLLNGVPAAATAVTIVATCQLLATIVPAYSGLSGDATSYLRTTDYGPWSALISFCGLASWGWPLLLLISAAASRDRRAIHDRLSGSVVVGRAPAFVAWGYPYGPTPGAPGGYEYGPGPGFAPGPVSPYGPQPGAPGQPPTDDPSGDQTQPAAWPGAMPPDSTAPSWGDQMPTSRGAEPAERKPAGENAQVFGARLPEGLRVAGFKRRASAFVLDMLVVLGLFGGIATAVLGTQGTNVTEPPERLAMLAGLLAGLAQAVVFVVTWSIWRGSIGQKVVGLQVADESTGRRLGWADSLVRWALLMGPFALYMSVPYVLRPLLGIVVIGWMWLLMYSVRNDPDGRGYHDRLAHSMVVEQT